MEAVTVYTDGASRGNPGPSASGYIIVANGKIIADASEQNPDTTNNVAEYTAMIKALEWCSKNIEECKNVSLSVISDSQLVVRQMNKIYKVKSAEIKPLMRRLLDLTRLFGSVKFEHRSREDPMISMVDSKLNQLLDRLESSKPKVR
jgi:ribonuclease HI